MTAEEAEEFRQEMKIEAYQEAEEAKRYANICQDLDNFIDYYQDELSEFEDKWREIKDLLDMHGYTDIKPEEII